MVGSVNRVVIVLEVGSSDGSESVSKRLCQ